MAKCPSCGVENLPNAERCRLCGKDMRTRPPQTDTTRCPHCGTINPSDEMTCSVCRRLLSATVVVPKERRERDVVYYDRPEITKKPRTSMPLVGGALLLIVGLCTLGFLVLVTLLSVLEFEDSLETLGGFLVLLWIMALLMVVGGVAAFMRKWWPVAELGSVVALILTFAFFNLVCMAFVAMSFAALLLISLSRAEFS